MSTEIPTPEQDQGAPVPPVPGQTEQGQGAPVPPVPPKE